MIDARSLLGNRRWEYWQVPFPHIRASEVFCDEAYERMECAYRGILRRGLAQAHDPSRLSRNLGNYNAYSFLASKDVDDPFAVFVSRSWHDLLAAAFEVRATGDIQVAFHHHEPNNNSGWVHNDLNPGWFANNNGADFINVGDERLCSYQSGEPYVEGIAVEQTIRAVAMLFYLANDPWVPGNGGETGLYNRATAAVEDPDAVMPPVNNSILVFECTPYSFHAFMGKNVATRNSIVMWLHRPYEDVVCRWGEQAIVPWTRS